MEVTTLNNPMAEFQEKLTAKIREDIAGLIPDEAVQSLIAKAVEQEFFKPRKVTVNSGWSNNVEERPSWFIEEVAKAAKPLLEAQIKEFVQNNEAVMKQAVEEFLKDQNLMLLAMAQMRSIFQSDMHEFATNLANQVIMGIKRPY